MDIKAFATLLDPAILFFFLGIFAALVRSNLEIPAPIAKFLSLYLLMAIGIKGGVALSVSGVHPQMLIGLAIALFMAFFVPLYTYPLLRRKVDGFNAAAIAATYGSVSAVTFIAAGQFLDNHGVEHGGYMAVALAIMEAPAVIMAVGLAALARRSLAKQETGTATPQIGKYRGAFSVKSILHESFTDGAILLLMGSLLIGVAVGEEGYKVMKPFTGDLFKGLLAFFLLEMGILVARRIREMKGVGPFLIGFAVLIPILNAMIVIFLSHLGGVGVGDTLMLVVLAASASYIVVPAVVRVAIPEANPGFYFGMALALTFPFNVVLGIPLYYHLIQIFFKV